MTRTLKRIKEELRWRMHHDVVTTAKWLGRVVNGWLNYYAVPTSFRYLRCFCHRLERLWLRKLRRQVAEGPLQVGRPRKTARQILAQAGDPTPRGRANDWPSL